MVSFGLGRSAQRVKGLADEVTCQGNPARGQREVGQFVSLCDVFAAASYDLRIACWYVDEYERLLMFLLRTIEADDYTEPGSGLS